MTEIWRSLLLALNVVLLAAWWPPAGTIAQPVQSGPCGEVTPAGALLLRPVSPTGVPTVGLVVADPATGDERGRIETPLVDAVFSTARRGLALAVSGAELYLIDTSELTATEINLSGTSARGLTPNPVQFRGTAGTRYLLLGSPSFDQVWLIDLERVTASDLTASVPAPAPDATVFLSFAAVTPDDAHVVLWDGRHVYVVETAAPDTARLVDTDAFAFAPDFSPDGSELIYSQSGGPGSGSSLVIEAMDGSDKRVLRTSDLAMVTLWVPASRTILIDERTESGAAAGIVSLLDLDTGAERIVLNYSGSLTSVQLEPTGRGALLGVESMSNGVWHLADLTTAEARQLPQLASGRALPGLFGDTRWALIVPSPTNSDPLSGPVYRAVDLETGVIARLLELDSDTVYDRQPVLSPDSSRALVFGTNDDGESVWLLDAVELQVRTVGSGIAVDALFSPDGCFVSIETSETGPSVVAMVRNGEQPIVVLERADLLAWVAE